ncbi:MAG: hypothetical protein K6E68_08300 [Lachnospiraceae bacterium]|nr:hypothetical protein [Lachnospiraceae bacterium]
MRFTPLLAEELNNETKESLKVHCKEGHTIGPVTVSDAYLFIKKGLRTYYIAYVDADKIFRRVRRLHANICCGDGDIEVEYLVIQAGDKELMEITLPGKKAAQMLLNEIKEKAPELDTTAPLRTDTEESDGEGA